MITIHKKCTYIFIESLSLLLVLFLVEIIYVRSNYHYKFKLFPLHKAFDDFLCIHGNNALCFFIFIWLHYLIILKIHFTLDIL